MSARDNRVRDLEEEAERYPRAAEFTLDHLAWCVSYLRQIGKLGLANQLERNRKQILDRL